MYFKKVFATLSMIPVMVASATLHAHDMKQKNPPAISRSEVQTLLTTLLAGDLERSQSLIQQFSKQYRHYLNEFLFDDFCVKAPRLKEGGPNSCERFVSEELKRIDPNNAWALNFSLDDAAFQRTSSQQIFATYNLIRILGFAPNYVCSLTLQLTANLNDPHFVPHAEFVPSCSHVAKDVDTASDS